MEKFGVKTRDIQFYSDKNDIMICVHSIQARNYARYLEEQSGIAGYEVGYRLDTSRFIHINRVGVRASYFETEWTSDFLLRYTDGRVGVRELVADPNLLAKRAVLEKLEFSRRYWAVLDAHDWKVVIGT